MTRDEFIDQIEQTIAKLEVIERATIYQIGTKQQMVEHGIITPRRCGKMVDYCNHLVEDYKKMIGDVQLKYEAWKSSQTQDNYTKYYQAYQLMTNKKQEVVSCKENIEYKKRYLKQVKRSLEKYKQMLKKLKTEKEQEQQQQQEEE